MTHTQLGRALNEVCGQASSLGGCGLVEDLVHLLGAVVGIFDTDVRLVGNEGCMESFPLTLA